jgi:hypothetical protein
MGDHKLQQPKCKLNVQAREILAIKRAVVGATAGLINGLPDKLVLQLSILH